MAGLLSARCGAAADLTSHGRSWRAPQGRRDNDGDTIFNTRVFSRSGQVASLCPHHPANSSEERNVDVYWLSRSSWTASCSLLGLQRTRGNTRTRRLRLGQLGDVNGRVQHRWFRQFVRIVSAADNRPAAQSLASRSTTRYPRLGSLADCASAAAQPLRTRRIRNGYNMVSGRGAPHPHGRRDPQRSVLRWPNTRLTCKAIRPGRYPSAVSTARAVQGRQRSRPRDQRELKPFLRRFGRLKGCWSDDFPRLDQSHGVSEAPRGVAGTRLPRASSILPSSASR
jgi:hypothetical protein